EAADHAIGCERCHGPGGHHVAAVDAGLSDLAIANPGAASAAEINKLCGQCHDIHRPSILSAPKTDPVWYRFQALALTWSRCYTESQGKLSCVSCHDPHRAVETSATRTEAACLSCHSAGTPTTVARAGSPIPAVSGQPASPTRGKPPAPEAKTSCPVNPASGCLGCHMPRAWQQGTHSFKTDHFIRVRDRTDSEERSTMPAMMP